MAKKFGKRGKPRGQQLPEDPRNMFGPPQLPRPSGPPASSTPLADYLAHGWPGVDSGYVVLPRSLAEGMSLPWQQQLVHLLAQFHEQHGRLTWPIYRVVPSRYERLVDLDEEQLAEAGYLVEIDVGGDMVYRERSGRKVEDPDNTTVLVSCLDPIVPPAARPPARQSAPPSGPVPAQPPSAPQQPAPPPPQQPRTPAPMNIGPQPVWHTTRSAPPEPPPPRSAQPAEPKQAPQTQERAQPTQQAQPASPQAEQRPEPQSRPQQSSPQSNAISHPQEPPAPARPAEPERQEPDTPPRGTRLPGSGARGWFDELPESGETAAHGEGKDDGADGEQFGPTGDPTEIPYRYRR